MKRKISIFVIISVIALLLQVEAKKSKKSKITQLSTFSYSYINKGFEGFDSGPNEITIIGPDINSTVKLTGNPELPISYLESDATRIIDGLAKE